MINTDNVKEFFLTTSARLNSYREFLAFHEAELAPAFNVFNFIDPLENTLSDIMAVLLDPKGAHGQGTTFLSLFLKEFIGDDVPIELLKTAKVKREHPTEMNRRVDILIQFMTQEKTPFWIGIEDKPWAGGQNEQVKDYIEYIEGEVAKIQGNFKFIYMPGVDGHPEEYSLPEEIRKKYESQYISKSYRDVRKWIDNCQLNCRAERVRCFLSDFERYIEKKFCGGLEMEKYIIKEEMLRSIENFKVATLAAKKINEIKIELLQQLRKDLDNKLKETAPTLILKWELDLESTHTVFIIDKKEWKNFCIAFEAEETQMMEFGYGILKKNIGKTHVVDLTNKIMEIFGNNNGGDIDSDYWLWSKYDGNENDDDLYRNWESNPKPWIEINNGIMVKKIMAKTECLIKKLEQFRNEAKVEI